MQFVLIKNNNRYFEREFNTEDEFEKIIFDNYKTIFGDETILVDAKKKISTFVGGTVPDGYLIDLSDLDNPEFYLVEIELSKHDFFKHIFPQITKFFAFFKNQTQQNELLEKLYNIIVSDKILEEDLRKHISKREIYKFLKDMLENSQNILLILDKDKVELPEIIATYTDTWGKMVKVEIIKEYLHKGDSIFSVYPDFEYIERFDASPSEEPEEEEGVQEYTEEYHLEGVSDEIKSIYLFFKEKLFEKIPTVKLNPQRYYISIRIKRNFAYFNIKKKKIRIVVMEKEEIVRTKIKFHQIKTLSEGVQKFYNAPCCEIILNQKKNLEEVLNLLLEIQK
jgi:predicted transport protein